MKNSSSRPTSATSISAEMIPTSSFPHYTSIPPFMSQTGLPYTSFVFPNSLANSRATTSANANNNRSSSTETPPPEPTMAEFKPIPIPGTIDFKTETEAKYPVKDEQKYLENGYQTGCPPSATAAWYQLPTANYSIYNNFYATPANYYHQYGYSSDYIPQNPPYCGQL
ncbi:hypothetical protein OSTOST_20526 [Ostertagia ostertagi]